MTLQIGHIGLADPLIKDILKHYRAIYVIQCALEHHHYVRGTDVDFCSSSRTGIFCVVHGRGIK